MAEGATVGVWQAAQNVACHVIDQMHLERLTSCQAAMVVVVVVAFLAMLVLTSILAKSRPEIRRQNQAIEP